MNDIASERSNVVAKRIENSGWPGRPRNVGTDAAQGEYIFFCDHDDYVFPEALERMYDFAATNNLDVLHPKEVVAGWSTPGWETWRQQRPQLDELDQGAIQCITPHKLYRRGFLNQAGIRFPEGHVRLEDFSFNALAWVRTKSIGVMSDYPCYRWVIYDDNSHKTKYDYAQYWKSFRSSLGPIINELPQGEKRNQLLVRWYRSRLLERLNGQFINFNRGYQSKLLETFADLLPLFPEDLDDYLTGADRARSYLLRHGTLEQLNELSSLDHGQKLAGTSLRIEWHGGKLQIFIKAGIIDKDGKHFPIGQTTDGRIIRSVPAGLRNDTPETTWDLTEKLKSAFAEIVVRDRKTNVDWILESTSDLQVIDGADSKTLEISVAARIDPRSAAMGKPLGDGVWDIFYRVSGLGYTATHRVPMMNQQSAGTEIGSKRIRAFATKNNFLALGIEPVRTSDPPSKGPDAHFKVQLSNVASQPRRSGKSFLRSRLKPVLQSAIRQIKPRGK